MINQIKTVLLLGLLAGIIILIGGLIAGQIGLLYGLIFALIINFATYWFSDKLVLAMYRAKLVTKAQAPNLYEIVEELTKKANLPMPKVYIIPTDNPNAFATGRNYKHAAVACTQGILKLLNKEELKGVLAHELSHIKNRDILISTIAATLAAIISYIAYMARFAAIFGNDRDNSNIFEILILSILAPIIALIIQLAISRSREYLADESGAKLMKNGKPLASALSKLEKASKLSPIRFGSPTTSSLFIVNPFSARGLIQLFSTHPDINSRIQRLNSMKF
jgi:heat shock protein HtpX